MEEKREIYSKDFRDTNIAKISGVLAREFESSHICYSEEFFSSVVSVVRRSGIIDNIPIIVSEDLIPHKSTQGKFVEIKGSVRSKDIEGNDGKRHLKVFVFVDDINICDDINELLGPPNLNYVYIDGLMCNKPYLRETPFGKKICDFIIKKSNFSKSYYIPCIAWSASAYEANEILINERIILEGRFQSRQYCKDGELREAYEISVAQLL